MKVDILFGPFQTLLEREVARFLKVIAQTVFNPLISSVLYLMIFGVSLGGNIEISGGIPYLAFLIPGIIMMGALNNAFQNSSSSIVAAKFSGDIEDLKVTPLSLQQIVWALSIGGLIRGMLVGGITWLVGFVFYYWTTGNILGLEHPLLFFLFLLLGGLCFAKLGICVAFWAKSFDQMSAVGGFVLLPLIYLGGVFFSVQGLHPVWQTIALFNPLFYLINGIRYGLLGVADVNWPVALGVTVIATVFFHFAAMYSLKKGSFSRW